MEQEMREHLISPDAWLRGFFILVFALICYLALILACAVIVFQFGYCLIKGRPEERLQRFGSQLSTYIYQILKFTMFNQDEKPYPFGEWPKE